MVEYGAVKGAEIKGRKLVPYNAGGGSVQYEKRVNYDGERLKARDDGVINAHNIKSPRYNGGKHRARDNGVIHSGISHLVKRPTAVEYAAAAIDETDYTPLEYSTT